MAYASLFSAELSRYSLRAYPVIITLAMQVREHPIKSQYARVKYSAWGYSQVTDTGMRVTTRSPMVWGRWSTAVKNAFFIMRNGVLTKVVCKVKTYIRVKKKHRTKMR